MSTSTSSPRRCSRCATSSTSCRPTPGSTGPRSPAGSAPCRPRSDSGRAPSWPRRGRPDPISARRQIEACITQCDDLTSDDGFFATSPGRASMANPCRRPPARAGRGRGAGRGAYAELGTFLADQLLPRARPRTPSGASATSSPAGYFLGATVDLEETYALGQRGDAPASTPRCARTAERIVPGGSIKDAIAALGDDPAYQLAGNRRPPAVDADQGRRGHGPARRHPLRHPRARADDRVQDRADPHRRDLLHGPERGLHPPGTHVVVRAPRCRDVRHVERAEHRLSRGRPRSSSPGGPDDPTAPSCSTAGAACCAG